MNLKKNSLFTGFTPLLMAARIGNEGIFRFLIEKGAYQNATNNIGNSALSLAIESSKYFSFIDFFCD